MTLAFLAVRKNARAFTTRKRDYLYTILGFSAPILFQPSPYSGPAVLGASLEVCGLVFVAGAFLYLNRSFGLSPQNRGIKTGGVYRIVRHPMYLGYILAEVGYVLDNFSDFNLFVLTVSVLFLLLRLGAEERLLSRDRNYRKYCRITRWKVVPLLY
jgi:protein-S-isoprenylcysteine O-methyltransferase Ste14